MPIVTRVTPDEIDQFYVFQESLKKTNPKTSVFVFCDEDLETEYKVLPYDSNIQKALEFGKIYQYVYISPWCLILDDLRPLLARMDNQTTQSHIIGNDDVCVYNWLASNTNEVSELPPTFNEGVFDFTKKIDFINVLDYREFNMTATILNCKVYEPWVKARYTKKSMCFPYELYHEHTMNCREMLSDSFVDNVVFNAYNQAHMTVYMNTIFTKWRQLC